MQSKTKQAELLSLRDKLLKGCALAFKRLVIKTAKDDGELVFWRDGRIVYVKAKDLLHFVGEEK